MGTFSQFSASLTKGNNYYNFLFAWLEKEVLPKGVGVDPTKELIPTEKGVETENGSVTPESASIYF